MPAPRAARPALDGKVTPDKEASGADMLDKTDAGQMVLFGSDRRKNLLFQAAGQPSGTARFTCSRSPPNEEMYEQLRQPTWRRFSTPSALRTSRICPMDFAKETWMTEQGRARGHEGLLRGRCGVPASMSPSDWVIDPDSPIYAAYVEGRIARRSASFRICRPWNT